MLIAAGQNRLAVLEGRNILSVFTLPGLRRLYSTSGPKLSFETHYLAMGSATNGPLLATNQFDESVLINVEQGGATPVEGSGGKHIGGGINVPVRASANGRLFVRGGFGNNDKSQFLTEVNGKWVIASQTVTNAYPSPDGRYIFGFSEIVNQNGQTVVRQGGGRGNGVWFVPAVHGTHYLKLTEVKDGTERDAKQAVSLSIHRDPQTPVPGGKLISAFYRKWIGSWIGSSSARFR